MLSVELVNPNNLILNDDLFYKYSFSSVSDLKKVFQVFIKKKKLKPIITLIHTRIIIIRYNDIHLFFSKSRETNGKTTGVTCSSSRYHSYRVTTETGSTHPSTYNAIQNI